VDAYKFWVDVSSQNKIDQVWTVVVQHSVNRIIDLVWRFN
jgi:hypothetical protein